eukprot:7070855-Lingulodinium_polyedra.AAC.1
MEVKRRRWAAKWEKPWDEERYRAVLRQATELIEAGGGPPEIDLRCLDGALALMDQRTGHGADCIGPRD